MSHNSGNKFENSNYEASLNQYFTEEKIANEFISLMTKLFYDKFIEMTLFRSQLIDRSASVVLYKHSYAERIVGRKLKILDSLDLANAIMECNVGPAKIDIGRLNKEWFAEGELPQCERFC